MREFLPSYCQESGYFDRQESLKLVKSLGPATRLSQYESISDTSWLCDSGQVINLSFLTCEMGTLTNRVPPTSKSPSPVLSSRRPHVLALEVHERAVPSSCSLHTLMALLSHSYPSF